MSDTELTKEENDALEAMKADTGQSDAQEVREQGEEGREAQVAEETTDETQEEKGEFKSSRSEQKPPEGFVPHQAMHAERTKRQELERKLEDMEKRFAAIEKPAEQEPQWVDPLVDPDGYRKYDEFTRQKAMQRLESFEESQRQQTAQQVRLAEAARLEMEFASQTPDYQDAAQYLHNARVSELRNMGYGDAEISQQISKDSNAIFDAAKAAGMNPAELLYMRAQRAGYAKADPQQSEAEKVVQLADAQQKTQGVSSAGGAKQSGRITMAQIAEMSESEFDKNMKERPDEMRRAMGG